MLLELDLMERSLKFLSVTMRHVVCPRAHDAGRN